MLNLSKSKYTSAVQCPKMLWLSKNKSEEFDDSELNTAVLAAGSEIGDLAMGLFGEYVEVPFDKENPGNMITETKRLLESGVKNICEASFSYNGLFCSVDILRNLGDNKVAIYEVKSSTKINDVYYDDVAYQNFVLRNLGIDVEGVFIVVVDNTYVRHGDIELDKLFKIVDVKEEADSRYDDVASRIAELEPIMGSDSEPSIGIGLHCHKPYDCGFFKYCTRALPKPNVFDLNSKVSYKKKIDYYRQGIVSYEDLLSDPQLSEQAKQEIRHESGNIPADVNVSVIKRFLDSLWYPLYFLDFESVASGVPLFDNSKPYQQICFQYSLHYYEEEGGELKHKEFLAYPGKDPRRELCERLCKDIPEGACTIIYNKSFEPARMEEMAALFPDLADRLYEIKSGMRDLAEPFSERAYFCKGMKGRHTIKNVLPAVFPDDPELDYHNLERVHNGGEATQMYLDMMKMDPEELEENRAHLLKYCCLDTYATVKLLDKLKEVAAGS